MMNRRRFLAAAGLLPFAPALGFAADVKASGRIIPGDRSKVLSSAADTPIEQIPNFRRYMREMITELGRTAHKRNLQVLVRNAPELLIKEMIEGYWEEQHEPGQPHLASGDVFTDYLDAIDGMIIDGLYWGNDRYGIATEHGAATPYRQAADVLKKAKRPVFSIEYAKDPKVVADIHKSATADKLISYVDQDGDMALASIPTERPWDENPAHVTMVSTARNWLPIFDGSKFPTRQAMIDALSHTSYDILAIDPFWRGEGFTFADVASLKTKPFGSRRMVLGRLPVGLASPKRWYWKKEWQGGPPAFLKQPMPENPNFWLVDYWSDDWKAIIGKYFTNMAAIGVDGFLIDAADAYLALEDMYPID